jgi:hypothetical protein
MSMSWAEYGGVLRSLPQTVMISETFRSHSEANHTPRVSKHRSILAEVLGDSPYHDPGRAIAISSEKIQPSDSRTRRPAR